MCTALKTFKYFTVVQFSFKQLRLFKSGQPQNVKLDNQAKNNINNEFGKLKKKTLKNQEFITF